MSESKKYAEYLVNKHKGTLYGIYENNLGNEMAGLVLTNSNIVYYVFVVLEERGYDSSTIIRVARYFLDATSQAVLNQIAATQNGRAVIKRVLQILKCNAEDNGGAARCMKLETARDIGIKVILAQKAANGTAQPRKLSSVEMDWYFNYIKGDLIFYERDGSGKLHSTGGKRNNFDSTQITH